MKNKIALLTLVGVFFTSLSFAQEATENYDQKFKLGIGINGGIPTGEPYDFNLGADARLQYDFNKTYSLTATTGFSNLFVEGKDNDLGYIPAKVGFKAFVFKDQFYLMGEVGAAFAVTNNYDKTSLMLSPTIGFATEFIDISLRYDHMNDFNVLNSDNTVSKGLGIIGLRLAYGFEL